MEELIRVVDFKNAIEAELFCNILDDNNIPYHLHSLNDSAYDGIYQFTHGWGFLEAKQEYKEQIVALYNDFKNSEIMNDENKQNDNKFEKEEKKERFTKYNIISICIFISLIIACSILAYNYFNLNKEVNYYRNRPLVYNSYNNKNRAIESYWKSTNIISEQYIDENSNLINEKIISYDTEGIICAIYIDKNENGIYEQSINYSATGRKTSEIFDLDENKRTDKWIEYIPNSAITVIWYDKDQDGIIDFREVYRDGKKTREINIRDEY